MATRKVEKIETPEGFAAAALAAARQAIALKGRLDGFSKRFTAAVLRLGAIGTDAARAAGDKLAADLVAETGGKSYASNARRILAASAGTCQKVLTQCEDEGGSGFPAPAGLFKKFPEEFPALTTSGRAANAAPTGAAESGVDLGQPSGMLLALETIRAKVPGFKAWSSDDIVALQDCAAKAIALIKRNAN